MTNDEVHISKFIDHYDGSEAEVNKLLNQSAASKDIGYIHTASAVYGDSSEMLKDAAKIKKKYGMDDANFLKHYLNYFNIILKPSVSGHRYFLLSKYAAYRKAWKDTHPDNPNPFLNPTKELSEYKINFHGGSMGDHQKQIYLAITGRDVAKEEYEAFQNKVQEANNGSNFHIEGKYVFAIATVAVGLILVWKFL